MTFCISTRVSMCSGALIILDMYLAYSDKVIIINISIYENNGVKSFKLILTQEG